MLGAARRLKEEPRRQTDGELWWRFEITVRVVIKTNEMDLVEVTFDFERENRDCFKDCDKSRMPMIKFTCEPGWKEKKNCSHEWKKAEQLPGVIIKIIIIVTMSMIITMIIIMMMMFRQFVIK